MTVWDGVPGQATVIARLREMVRRPVHAYLFVGPPGVGKEEAARAFAASLMCAEGGCGECRECRTARSGRHPDLVELQRSGAAISVDQAREVIGVALRMPMQARRTVVILPDFHLVDEAAPALLKTLEEPPPTTVFVVLTDTVTPHLVTVASRCVEVAFGPLTPDQIVAALTGEGVDTEVATRVSRFAGGRLDRARRSLVDVGIEARHELWAAVPGRLDGTGATVAVVARELLGAVEESLEPLVSAQDGELSGLAELSKAGRSSPSKTEVQQRHKRELRRVRIEELRFGLATLAGAYRDRVVLAGAGGSPGSPGSLVSPGPPRSRHSEAAALGAVRLIDEAAAKLDRNPNEALLLQDLLVRLSGMV